MFCEVVFLLLQPPFLNPQSALLVLQIVLGLSQFRSGGSFCCLQQVLGLRCQSRELGQTLDMLKLNQRI